MKCAIVNGVISSAIIFPLNKDSAVIKWFLILGIILVFGETLRCINETYCVSNLFIANDFVHGSCSLCSRFGLGSDYQHVKGQFYSDYRYIGPVTSHRYILSNNIFVSARFRLYILLDHRWNESRFGDRCVSVS